MSVDLTEFNIELEAHNYAEDLGDEELTTIAFDLLEKIEEDEDSRSEWMANQEMWQKLAYQVMENKNHPWPNASNVKLPILSTAAVQFHARAYPSLVNEGQLVKTKVLGQDDEKFTKSKIAEAVSRYLKYQFLHGIENWQEDMDRLLLILPIVGLAYKKLFFNHSTGKNDSKLVLAKDLIINYWATDYERARKTHVIEMDINEVVENQRSGYFIDCDLEDLSDASGESLREHRAIQDDVEGTSPPGSDDDVPRTIYECHCWLDLDMDGYKEPWIVTLDAESEKILRIQARWFTEDRIVENDVVKKIKPRQHFIPYKFLPDPNSCIYALGFGHLLGPTNSAVNTIINNLIDAGTLSNLPSGFLGKGIRARTGKFSFRPGEWKSIMSTGDDLARNIVPLPTKEPSAVLFNLLGMLVEYGERLASVKDIMVGENPGQNQPYSTSMAVLEQGMKVFVGIYKRIYRSFGEEINLLFDLNNKYLEDEEAGQIMATGERTIVYRSYFDRKTLSVLPGADPNIMSDSQKMLKATSLEQKLAMGWPLNPQLVQRKVLEAEGHDDIDDLLNAPPPGPSPEIQLKMRELDIKERLGQLELQLEMAKAEYEPLKDFASAMKSLAQAEAADDATTIAQFQAIANVTLQQIRERINAHQALKEGNDTDEQPETQSGEDQQ